MKRIVIQLTSVVCDCCRRHAVVKHTRVVYVTTTQSFMRLTDTLLSVWSAVCVALNSRLASFYCCCNSNTDSQNDVMMLSS